MSYPGEHTSRAKEGPDGMVGRKPVNAIARMFEDQGRFNQGIQYMGKPRPIGRAEPDASLDGSASLEQQQNLVNDERDGKEPPKVRDTPPARKPSLLFDIRNTTIPLSLNSQICKFHEFSDCTNVYIYLDKILTAIKHTRPTDAKIEVQESFLPNYLIKIAKIQYSSPIVASSCKEKVTEILESVDCSDIPSITSVQSWASSNEDLYSSIPDTNVSSNEVCSFAAIDTDWNPYDLPKDATYVEQTTYRYKQHQRPDIPLHTETRQTDTPLATPKPSSAYTTEISKTKVRPPPPPIRTAKPQFPKPNAPVLTSDPYSAPTNLQVQVIGTDDCVSDQWAQSSQSDDEYTELSDTTSSHPYTPMHLHDDQKDFGNDERKTQFVKKTSDICHESTLSASYSSGALSIDLIDEQNSLESESEEEKADKVLQAIRLDKSQIGNWNLGSVVGFHVTSSHPDTPFILQYIQKIIMLDFRFRDNLVKAKLEQKESHRFKGKKSKFRGKGDRTDNGVHPMDIMLAVFLSGNHVLRQIMAERFFVCKLAIPFLLNRSAVSEPQVLLWALRGIVAEWRAGGKAHEMSIVKNALYVISAIRLGKSTRSKSKVLNDLLNPAHQTFYHRDCPSGRARRRISNGIVEIAFSLPADRSDDLLDRAGLFCNLRGDALAFSQHVDFLKMVSRSLMVFVDIKYLYASAENKGMFLSIFKANAHIHILLSVSGEDGDNDEQLMDDILEEVDISRYSLIVLEKEGNHAEEIESLKDSFRDAKKDRGMSIEEIAHMASKRGFKLDEDMTAECKKIASTFSTNMANTTKPKERIFPLQGEPWSKLVEIERTAKKVGTTVNPEKSVEIYKDGIKKQRRIQQRMLGVYEPWVHNCILELKVATHSFLTMRQKKEEARASLETLVRWYKLYFDGRSREILPKLQAQYDECYQNYRKAMNQDQPEKNTRHFAEKLQQIEKRKDTESLGLENVARELGQIYEALIGPPNTAKTWGKLTVDDLSDIAVAILLTGHPFEIINGDGTFSNIPLTWVNAVLGNLKSKIGDEKIFVLSILGVQSSGKSTLLNAMFGVNFAVSAGRCTRGIFVQLIPVTGAKFKYALIVDTEGLRANELKRQNHDNELATIAIGLGDVTIVNIKGENHADIEEVLQITVQAFLRIKAVQPNIKLHQRCIFVHQNVASPNAKEKLMQGRKRFLESLDEITKNAAMEENVVNVKQFSDVIRFDMMQDVWYFPDLWFGSPPMAPVNPEYTEMVAKVKEHVFEVYGGSQDSYLKISEFSKRLTDLWKAIISDDFVYNFRNHLELKAYGDLETKYNGICLDFDNELSDYVNERENTLTGISDIDKLNSFETRAKADLDIKVSNLEVTYSQKLEEFFDGHDHKQVLAQWRTVRMNKFKHFKEEKALNAQDIMKTAVANAKAAKGEVEMRARFEAELRRMASDLARTFKESDGTIDQKLLTEPFEKKIDKLLYDVRKQIPKEGVDIEWETRGAMLSVVPHKWKRYFVEQLEISQTNPQYAPSLEAARTPIFYTDDCLSIRKTEDASKKQEYIARLQQLTDEILNKIASHLQQLTGVQMKFHRSHPERIFRSMFPLFDAFNSRHQQEFTATSTCIAKICMASCGYIIQQLQSLHDKYNDTFGLMAQLKAYKVTAWKLFIDLVSNRCGEEIAADMFCTRLENLIADAMSKKLQSRVSDDITRQFHNKFKLLYALLKDLAETDDTDGILEYLWDPKMFALRWLGKFTDIQLMGEEAIKEKKNGVWGFFKNWLKSSKGSNTISGLEKYADGIIKDYVGEIVSFVSNNQSSQDTIHVWMDNFQDRLKEKLPMTASEFEQVTEREIHDLNSFCNNVLGRMDELKKDILENHCKGKDISTFNWTSKSKPHEAVLDRLWGCEFLCPFCAEPCQHIKNHESDKEHTCIQHKPEGLIRGHYRDNNKLVTFACSSCVAKDSKMQRYCTPNHYLKRCLECSPPDSERLHYDKDYKQYTDNWDIEPSATEDNFYFWQYIMNRVHKELARKYGYQPADIPGAWKDISKKKAIESLKMAFDITEDDA